jgi:hypothetical protein
MIEIAITLVAMVAIGLIVDFRALTRNSRVHDRMDAIESQVRRLVARLDGPQGPVNRPGEMATPGEWHRACRGKTRTRATRRHVGSAGPRGGCGSSVVLFVTE